MRRVILAIAVTAVLVAAVAATSDPHDPKHLPLYPGPSVPPELIDP